MSRNQDSNREDSRPISQQLAAAIDGSEGPRKRGLSNLVLRVMVTEWLIKQAFSLLALGLIVLAFVVVFIIF